ncbi:MAG: CehA/McbA family metallohydrolase [Chloroflexi bacterium]|nr:CehA/McbA family metallohydrolase [Chloroflexota bacterium]
MHFAFNGTFILDDMHNHVPHAFTVPAGAQQLTIHLDFEPKGPEGAEVPHEISLSLFDPVTGRGARHNNADQTIVITADSASPGYTPGPLQPGTWTVFIDTHRIMPPGDIRYTLDVDIAMDAPEFQRPQFTPGSTAARGPGWYRGDLHGHTLHSDGRWDVAEFVADARRRGLDFVFLTDHNTVSSVPEVRSYASDALLTLGGIELTTFYGHCLALGAQRWHEWRVRDGHTMTAIAREVLDAGAFYVIAHPTSIGYPRCSGCPWHYEEMMPGIAPAVEVWNGDWAGESQNEQAVQLYYQWLNQGHQLVATAGSDIHGPLSAAERPGYNVVYAADLSEAAILDALRAGHLYVSSGPKLAFSATSPRGETAMMGDVLVADRADLHARWEASDPAYAVRLVAGGVVVDSFTGGAHGEKTWQVTRDTMPAWYTVEIRAADGQLHALTNPIFLQGS